VVAGVGARTVNSPGSGISFNSSGSLQTAINANPSLSTFVCSTNTPTWNSTVDTGTKSPMIIFPGTPGQCVIDGGFSDNTMLILRNGATVMGGTWRNLGTTAPGPFVFLTAGDGATIQDVIGHNSLNVAAKIQALNTTISHCRFHTNGRYGLSTGGTGPGQVDGLIVEYCDVENNNTSNTHGGSAGGSKFGYVANGIWRFNWFHANHGFALWLDTGCINCILEENVCEDNDFTGLFYEANDGSVIRRNYVANNGNFSGSVGTLAASFVNNVNLRISDDNCATVRGQCQNNLIDFTPAQDGTKGGLLLLWDHSGTVARSVQNWDVHDNQFWLRGTTSMRVGGQDSGAGLTAFPVWSEDNNFFSNQYRVASMSTSYWKWDTGGGSGVAQTYSAWQGFHTGDNIARIQI
jgi:parallel beta-helix repeat protein